MLQRLAVACMSALLPATAMAQVDLPCSQVRIVVPYSAGGATDVVTRLVADGMSQKLGKKVVVDSRPGAGGNIGTREVVAAKPDGCTLLVNGNQMATMPVTYANLGYDPFKDLVAIGNVGYSPALIVTAVPEFKTVKDLLDKAQSEPISYGTPGLGQFQHLSMEVIAKRTGAQLRHIPYGGGAQALSDLTTGRLAVGTFAAGSVIQYVRDGAVRILAPVQNKRSSFAPDVPSIAEQGITDLNGGIYFMLFAPGATPKETVDFLSGALAAVVAEPKLADHFAAIGFEPTALKPAEAAAIMQNSAETWNPVVKELGIKFD